ncbi:CDP-diacylglycerol--glycerol-3-phosphate 3-phosphatidyltransferase 2-like [Solanum stenotomum]|uniref:CDP-diacylglycerol--glycerol-3-phosphate 3-phosphatidyltransferase 2-like n=1 Tax=Solanum stenotomum TaxID=172797 RepID=UPI0020D099CC|nr:CDP-diacylglycerol--glycerol-3-phosphate 3-phosphatidyltransferase 2-like [Solanum stenotomum]
MLVGLKLKAVVSIYGHMPYNFYRTFSSTAAPTTNFPVVPTHIYRCRRISTPAPGFLKVSVFSCQKEKEEYAPFSVRNISTTGMGYTPGNKEDHHREKTLRSSSSSSAPSKSAKLLTLPTILTIGRVAAIPVLVTTFYVDSWWGPTATTGIFIAAAITDWLDGYLARKMNLGTAFGAFLDPVADKLMVAATLILLCTKPLEASLFGQLPWLLTVPSIAIIGREITMSAVREWAASQGGKLSEAVAVNNLGKWKTATQMTALTILLLTRDSSLSGAGTFVASGVILLYVSAWLALWSLVVYMRKISKVLLM